MYSNEAILNNSLFFVVHIPVEENQKRLKPGYFSKGNHRDKLVFASEIEVEDIDDHGQTIMVDDDGQEENLDDDLEDNLDEDSEEDPGIDLEYHYDDELEGNDDEDLDDELEVDNVELTSNTSVPWLHNELTSKLSFQLFLLAKD